MPDMPSMPASSALSSMSAMRSSSLRVGNDQLLVARPSPMTAVRRSECPRKDVTLGPRGSASIFLT
ncbi:Uncharacterised protein [Mycobacteroides abscessus subsp. abscessus]|nr:Uncharacterised protein [Mycobacteroides abscessus subsp. abscessus]